MTQRIAVIGAGPSGLCSLRHLSKYPEHFELVAFDKAKDIGGLWNYSDYTEVDEYGLPCYSSMYKGLITNTPKEIMGFPDFDFSKELPSFMPYAESKKYLDSYADHFELRKYVKFQTLVTNVKPTEDSNGRVHWMITTRDLKEDLITTSVFDAVLICNGNAPVANMPAIPGQDAFKGQVIHSKNYRDKEHFRGKKVLIIGASMSARDLMLQLDGVARQVIIAHRDERLHFKLPENVEETENVREILSNGVILQNGECREADTIIFATGFHFLLDFLSDECLITLQDDRIAPLYNNLINIKYPTMIFMALWKRTAHWLVAHVQAQYVCALFRGEFHLPPEEEMLRKEEHHYHSRVVTKEEHPKMTHDLMGSPEDLRNYVREIEREGKLKALPNVAFNIWEHVVPLYNTSYDNIQKRNYTIVNEEEFEELWKPNANQ